MFKMVHMPQTLHVMTLGKEQNLSHYLMKILMFTLALRVREWIMILLVHKQIMFLCEIFLMNQLIKFTQPAEWFHHKSDWFRSYWLNDLVTVELIGGELKFGGHTGLKQETMTKCSFLAEISHNVHYIPRQSSIFLAFSLLPSRFPSSSTTPFSLSPSFTLSLPFSEFIWLATSHCFHKALF